MGSGVSRTFDPTPSDPIVIVIEPSMAFGTGHHASTRLCLRALQRLDVRDRAVLDVGTGSGVLAIAAVRLGARRVVAIDRDPEAIACARDNLRLNPGVADRITLSVAEIPELERDVEQRADVVVANLTGAILRRHASDLIGLMARGASLIVSGLTANEERDVAEAFLPLSVVEREQEDDWVALTLA